MRLDLWLVENGYYESRSKAALAIKEKQVFVNGRAAFKTGEEIRDNDCVSISKKECTFVSRAGEKLQGAIEKFNIDLKGKIVLDIGASTGGFTDCALQHGAVKVYSYDVGHNQLHPSLRSNPKVICKEGINCRDLRRKDFEDTIDFICMDVSFISCTKMLDAIADILKTGNTALILFKPQFEVGPQYLDGQGLVTSDKIIKEKMVQTIDLCAAKKLVCSNVADSPIKGKTGNKEYLLYLTKID